MFGREFASNFNNQPVNVRAVMDEFLSLTLKDPTGRCQHRRWPCWQRLHRHQRLQYRRQPGLRCPGQGDRRGLGWQDLCWCFHQCQLDRPDRCLLSALCSGASVLYSVTPMRRACAVEMYPC